MKLTKRDIELLREVHEANGLLLLHPATLSGPDRTEFYTFGRGETADRQTPEWLARMIDVGALSSGHAVDSFRHKAYYIVTPEGLAAIGEEVTK